MVRRWMAVVGALSLVAGMGAWSAGAATAFAASPTTSTATSSGAASPAGTAGPAETRVCADPPPGYVACPAIELVDPYDNWHPGAFSHGSPGRAGRDATAATPAPPSSGYYPADLLSAYGLTSAASSFPPGPSAPTVAVVDAYDDPNAASDLAAYRASMSGATDANTGLTDPTIPPLCSSTVTTGCVTFTKVSQTGTTSYPAGNTGWAGEISLDLDMVSAVCPDCNIVLVEATSATDANLAAAVTEAKTFHPASIGNSYGGGESSSETSDNSVYSAGAGMAVTAASGDDGYVTSYPATAPGLTAVGGTSLSYTGSGAGLSWKPQTVWYTSSKEGAGSGCSSVESMPAWQDVPGVYFSSSDCSRRQMADISAVADPATGVATYETYGASGWVVYGGTSVSTQIISAVYGLAAGDTEAGTFEPSPSYLYPDTTGNGHTGPTPGLVPVATGSTAGCGNYLCNAADSLPSGYNGPTGLGTPYGLSAFVAPTAGSLSFSPTSETVTAGVASGAITVGTGTNVSSELAVTLSATSGGFATSSAGPFSSPMTVDIGAGTSQSPAFYYESTVAGSPSVQASASGWAGASLPVTVDAGPLAKITVSPSTATVAEGATQPFSATGYDAYNNPVSIAPNWSATPSGSVNPSTASSTTTFTAGSSAGPVTVTATQGGVSGSAAVTVSSEPSMTVTVTAGSVSHSRSGYQVPLTVTVRNSSSNAAISGASVTMDVYAGSTCSGTVSASGTGTTGRSGTDAFTFTTSTVGTWCALASVTDSGYQAAQGHTTFST